LTAKDFAPGPFFFFARFLTLFPGVFPVFLGTHWFGGGSLLNLLDHGLLGRMSLGLFRAQLFSPFVAAFLVLVLRVTFAGKASGGGGFQGDRVSTPL